MSNPRVFRLFTVGGLVYRIRTMQEAPMTFLKNLFTKERMSKRRRPEGKQAVSGVVEIPGGKSFKVVREDILRKGLSHRSAKEAA